MEQPLKKIKTESSNQTPISSDEDGSNGREWEGVQRETVEDGNTKQKVGRVVNTSGQYRPISGQQKVTELERHVHTVVTIKDQ